MRRAAAMILAAAAAMGSAAAQEVGGSSGGAVAMDGVSVGGDGRVSGRVSGGEEWLEAIAPRFDSIVGDPVAYRRVADKFSAAIVRLSAEDCATVYYGFPMQPEFTATVQGEGDMQRAIMAEDYATAYTLGVEVLKAAPVNMTALYWTLYAATETRQPWEVRNALRGRYNSLAHVMSLSGDGRSPRTAFKVVWESEMYTYTMLELGLEIGDGYIWDDRWTEFEVKPARPDAGFEGESIFFELWRGGEGAEGQVGQVGQVDQVDQAGQAEQ